MNKPLLSDISGALRAFVSYLSELWHAIPYLLRMKEWTPPLDEINERYFRKYLSFTSLAVKILAFELPAVSPWCFWRESAKTQLVIKLTTLHKIEMSFWQETVFVIIRDGQYPEKNVHFIVIGSEKKSNGDGTWWNKLFLEPESLIANLDCRRIFKRNTRFEIVTIALRRTRRTALEKDGSGVAPVSLQIMPDESSQKGSL